MRERNPAVSERTNRRLADLLDPLVPEAGLYNTDIPGVAVMRAVESFPRHPIVYTPRIIVMAQGRKRVFLGEESYVYDANNYLVLSVPMPLECETEASQDEPLLGLMVSVDPILVGELLLEMDDAPVHQTGACVGSTPMSSDVIDVAERIAQALASPADSRILGQQLVRELVYRVLRGEQGDVLRLLTAGSTRFGHIARILRRIHEDYAKDLDVASLAREANMGTSTFHHAFREATSTSPVQYVKRIRLHRARMLLVTEGVSAQDAARAVGYASASQFSREYTRMFGSNPSADRAVAVA